MWIQKENGHTLLYRVRLAIKKDKRYSVRYTYIMYMRQEF